MFCHPLPQSPLVKVMNERMKQSVNTQAFQMDELNQYGRRENIRILSVAQENNSKDDTEKVVKKVTAALGVQISDRDIERAQQIGRKLVKENLDQ